MPTLEREPTITPVLPDDNDSSATVLAVVLAFVLTGVIGYALYSFNYAMLPPVAEKAAKMSEQAIPYGPYAPYSPPSRNFP